jgi:hypothetical protein
VHDTEHSQVRSVFIWAGFADYLVTWFFSVDTVSKSWSCEAMRYCVFIHVLRSNWVAKQRIIKEFFVIKIFVLDQETRAYLSAYTTLMKRPSLTILWVESELLYNLFSLCLCFAKTFCYGYHFLMWHGNITAVGKQKTGSARYIQTCLNVYHSNYSHCKVAVFLIHTVVVSHRVPVKYEK